MNLNAIVIWTLLINEQIYEFDISVTVHHIYK